MPGPVETVPAPATAATRAGVEPRLAADRRPHAAEPARAAGRPAARRGEETGLAAAARKFEALVLQEMLRTASRPLLPGGSPLDGGSAGRLYRELFYAEAAKLAARRGDLGIASAIERQAGGGHAAPPETEEAR